MAIAGENSRRRSWITAELLGQVAKPHEKILIHQIDESRFVLRVNLKSRRPFHITKVTIRADERVGVRTFCI